MALLAKFSDHEDRLIQKFHEHPFFQGFPQLTDLELKDYLLQKWFLSLHFVPWYDRAINGLSDPEAKDVLKRIIQDENPLDAPSHREDLLADLDSIGISKDEVLTAKPTRATLRVIDALFSLTNYPHSSGCSRDPDSNTVSNSNSHLNYDLRVMVALRTAGEILVAEEYRHVVPELEKRYGLTPDKSRFYAPHFYHDRKDSDTGQHTHSFESVLERMIDSEEKLETAIQSATTAFQTRLSFYDQFDGRGRTRRVAITAGALAAAAGFLLTVASYISPIYDSPQRDTGNQQSIPSEQSSSVSDEPSCQASSASTSSTSCSDGLIVLERQANTWLLDRYPQTK